MKELNVIPEGRRAGSVEVPRRFARPALQRKSSPEAPAPGHWRPSPRPTFLLASDLERPSSSASTCVPERKAQELADQEKSRHPSCHSIIYELQDEIKRAMTGLLGDHQRGLSGTRHSSRKLSDPKVGTIAGCRRKRRPYQADSEVRLPARTM